jgi:hypothetical protein
MNDILYLPVSLGEAIDKLTILDIKLDNIKDERQIDVKIEYDLLFDKLKLFIDKYNNLYISMKKVNLIIWNQMDNIRDINIKDDKYIKLCKECIEMNDIRFRIKNKINLISSSIIKEQKGYKLSSLIIVFNILNFKYTKNYLNIFINSIKYLSYIYDEIKIIDNYNNINNYLIKYFNYDTTIKFIESLNNNINFNKKIEINISDITNDITNITDSDNKYENIYILFDIEYKNIQMLI